MRAYAAALVVPVLLASACSSGSSPYAGSTGSTPTPTPAASSASAAPAAAGKEGALTIAGFGYDPSPMTVKAGQAVVVTNDDSADHTVSSDLAGLFSASVSRGTPVTFKAPAKPGRYTFHCAFHPSMHGTLVVTS